VENRGKQGETVEKHAENSTFPQFLPRSAALQGQLALPRSSQALVEHQGWGGKQWETGGNSGNSAYVPRSGAASLAPVVLTSQY